MRCAVFCSLAMFAACTDSTTGPDIDAEEAKHDLVNFAAGGLELEAPLARIDGGLPCGAADQTDTYLTYSAQYYAVSFKAYWRCVERNTIEQLQTAFIKLTVSPFEFDIP